MELSESDSISVPIATNDSELGFNSAILFPALKPTSNRNQSPDLDYAADTLDSLPKEFQNKLELKENGDGQVKGGGEGEEGENDLKVSNFNGGFGEETQEKVEEGVDCGGGDSGWGENVYEDSRWTEDVGWNDTGRRLGEFDDDGAVLGDDVNDKYERSNGDSMYQYPLRPEAEDCAFYMKTGTCKFGSNCKFNHPLRRKNQVYKGKVRVNEESTERSSQTECKYHLSSGGCKYGQTCRYNHTGMRSSPAPPLELNFLGLPIRLGAKECPYYMRNGSCKYGASCKFNHPDPTAVGGGDSPSAYSNGGRLPLQGITQDSVATWSTPVTLTEAAPFVPLMSLPNQVVSHRSPEWNGYQYIPQRNMGPSEPYVMNSLTTETNAYGHLQQQMQVDEFPERPGEPDCSYFLKTGNCKFKSNCKFHHPKNQIARTPPCTLNDKGLPLRPDQNVCTHYSRYGICKFGPACKFDHPIHSASPMSGLDQHSSYANSTTSGGPGISRTGSGIAALVHPSV